MDREAERPAGTSGAESTAAGPGEEPVTGTGLALQPVPTPPWATARTTRKRRAARAPLDREQIIRAALRIVDADGVDALSLRRLADDLGVTAMSLYWHVRDKAELLELMGHAVLAEVEIPERQGSWKEQLADVHRAMLRAVLRHPNMTDVLAGRARFGPAGLAMFERILGILLEAGLAPDQAFQAYMSMYVFTLGFMATANRSPEFREVQRQGVLYMLSLPPDRFPSIRAVAPTIGRLSIDEQFELDLRIQIEGIEALLVPKG